MDPHQTASEWASTRGEKWSAQLREMEAMLAPVDDVLIPALCLNAPYRVADIGCGGGGTSLEILRRAPAGSEVHGFDISPRLIEFARDRALREGVCVPFEIADVSIATPERPFDRLASRFGVMFFHDPPSAFANLFHWLAPGGRFAFAVWGPVAENPWRADVHAVVARIVDVPPIDEEGPGAFRYANAEKFLAVLRAAGFADLDVHDWRGMLEPGGGMPADEAAKFAIASFSSFSDKLAEAGEEAARRAHASLVAHLSHYEQDGVVRMGASIHIVTGSRPA